MSQQPVVHGVAHDLRQPRVQCVDVAVGQAVGLEFTVHERTADGRTVDSGMGPNAAVIWATCTYACRTVRGRRVAYPVSQVSHQSATVVRAAAGGPA